MEEVSKKSTDDNFERLLEDSVTNHLEHENKVQNGALVEGTIIKITTEDVFLDIGLKTEGIISLSEFDTNSPPKEGDKVSAVVSKRMPDAVLLSFTKARGINAIEELAIAFENNLSVSAKITEIVNGGFIAHIDKTLKAFVPISQIDIIRVDEEQAKKFLGKTFDFLIIQLYKGKQSNIVLTRRKLLYNVENEKKTRFFEEKHEGDIVTGIVKNHASFGVFVDLGGFDGLLHVSDLSWGKNIKPSELAPKNAKLELMIIKLDKEHKKINLSLKALSENPWNNIENILSVGSVVSGTIVKILAYGAFINIDNNIEGFLHVSDISWTKHINHPKEVLTLNSTVDCRVLSIEKEISRISLGIKQVENNPWDDIEKLFPLGTKFTVPIVKILTAGCIVELENGIKGFISRDDYAWNRSNEINLKEGEDVECMVIAYDLKAREIKLGIKQLGGNPWKKEKFKVGDIVSGTISNITDFGIFLKITDDIEGLISKFHAFDTSEYSSFEEARLSFKKGDVLQVVIQNINFQTQKISLSIKELKKSAAKQEFKKHLAKEKETHSVNLGDILSQNK